MNELFARIGEDFWEGDGWVRIISADWLADELRLEISIKLGGLDKPEVWEINCGKVFEERLRSECSNSFFLTNDSPVLIPYKDKEVKIAFSENNLPANELLGIVTSTCFKCLGSTANISDFINTQPTSDGICSSKYGLLGIFPERVADQLLETLSALDIKVNKFGSFLPTYWTGGEHAPYPDSLKVLFIGSSYVIGSDFHATQV